MVGIEQEVLSKLKALIGYTPKLSDSLALIGLDSVALAELTFELEKSFGIRFDESILEINTVADLIEHVREIVDSRSN